MNKDSAEAVEFLESLAPQVGSETMNVRVRLFPPFLSLESSARAAIAEVGGGRIEIGAQNAHWEENGAFTGEISGPMLKAIGVNQVLIGHSERRQFFGETDETVFKRTKSLLSQGFEVMVCVGESLAERESGKTRIVIERQIASVFTDKLVNPFCDGRVSIAYEPVWAIGTGKTASPVQAQEVHRLIREWLAANVSEGASNMTPILYGGSVKPGNFSELLSCADIDGGLVGGASLEVDTFASLVKIAKQH